MPDKQYYNYLFHWNPFTETWNCFPRDGLRSYFNGEGKKYGSGKTIKEAYSDMTSQHNDKDEIRTGI